MVINSLDVSVGYYGLQRRHNVYIADSEDEMRHVL